KGEKTVVYSAFKTYGVRKLQEMLKNDPDGPIPYVEVTGDMSIKARDEAVKKYNRDYENYERIKKGKKPLKDQGVKVIFITKAGGEGLDLKGTRKVILLEKSWNRPNELQIIGRADRYLSHSYLPE